MRPLTLSLAAVIGSFGLIGAVWWNHGGHEEIPIMIPSGLTATETAQLLKTHDVIRSVGVFKVVVKLMRKDRSLKPGTYVLRRYMSAPAAIRMIHRGSVENVRVVFPEGFMAKQIANRLEAAGITDAAKFMAYVRENDLEGFLFPTTYFFSKGLPAALVANYMHAEFDKQVNPIFSAVEQDRFTLKQVVTVAAIVQREARVIDEMPKIAAVYLNRIKKRMRLEADPTVQYAMGMDTGKWFKGLRFKHLKNPSKYNTYVYRGLPPGPICSPGADAVRAVLSPADVKFLYFVADNTGRHHFSRTYKEHQRASAKAKAERRREKWRKKRNVKK